MKNRSRTFMAMSLPVIIIFRPGLGIFSRTVTEVSPEAAEIFSAAPTAAIRPAAPAPMIIISEKNIRNLQKMWYENSDEKFCREYRKNNYLCSPFGKNLVRKTEIPA